MSPANGLMRIVLLLFAVCNFLTFVKGMQRPWFGSHHYSNRPGPPTDGYGFPTNWDDKRFPNGYPLYCKKLHKKISIDEQIFPFTACVFEDDNTDDDSEDGYSQDYLSQSNSNMIIGKERNLPLASFNAPSNQGNWRKNSKSKGPLISNFNSPQNSGVLGLNKEVLGNGHLGSTKSVGKTDSSYEYPQRSGFQVPGETKNGFTNFVDSDDHLSRDRFGFSKDELRDPSKFLIEAKSFNKQKSGKEAFDELEKLEASNEIINNQLDRDRILSVLSSKSRYDFDKYGNIDNFHYRSLFPSSNAGNDDKNLKFPIKPSSTNNSNEKNSSTSVNETTPKSILKKKNYQETKASPPQFYRYSPSHQNVTNTRFSQMGPSSYHGLQTGSFSINGFGPFNSVHDESSLQELE